MGPHPHDLYLALSALGVICINDPLSQQRGAPWPAVALCEGGHPHDLYPRAFSAQCDS
jgi:hypothetical protein